jgi:hypothetical protein
MNAEYLNSVCKHECKEYLNYVCTRERTEYLNPVCKYEGKEYLNLSKCEGRLHLNSATFYTSELIGNAEKFTLCFR